MPINVGRDKAEYTCAGCLQTGERHAHSGYEIRVTNEQTGGMKGSKIAQLFDAPPAALLALARVYGKGAEKYDHHNYRKGYKWSLSYNALLRHVLASIDGEDVDPESGELHMAHAAWHCLTLIQFLLDKQQGRHPPDLDDRWEYPDEIEIVGKAAPEDTRWKLPCGHYDQGEAGCSTCADQRAAAK